MKKATNMNTSSDVSTPEAALSHVEQSGGEGKPTSKSLAQKTPREVKGYTHLETVPIKPKSEDNRGEGY